MDATLYTGLAAKLPSTKTAGNLYFITDTQEIYFDKDSSTRVKMSMGNAAAASHTHAASDVTSGTFDAACIPNLAASKITSGTLATARGGTGTDGSSVTANKVLASPNGSTGAVSYRTLVAADIPSLAASKITSGTLAVARGGTGADGSSVTKNYVLAAPSTAAGTVSYRALVADDIPSLAASKIGSGTLAVARGGTGGGDAATARTNLGAAAKTTKSSMTLTASSWTLNSTSGFYEYSLTGTYPTATYDLEIDLDWDDATEDQSADWASCQIVGSYDSNKLVARGGQPAENYPIVIYATALT